MFGLAKLQIASRRYPGRGERNGLANHGSLWRHSAERTPMCPSIARHNQTIRQYKWRDSYSNGVWERLAEAGGKGGGISGETLGGRPNLPQGSMESNEGMVTGGGKLHPPSHRLVWKRRHQRGWASIGGTPPPKDLISILVTLVEVQEEPSEAE